MDTSASENLTDVGLATSGSEALLEAARPDLYRVNAFRVTGLPVDATTRDIARQGEKIKMLEKLGRGAPQAGGVLGLDPPPDTDVIREAEQRLRDPEQRLVNECFWFWPQQWRQSKEDEALVALQRGDLGRAAEIWMQQESYSDSGVAVHNLAVLCHLRALDLEHAAQSKLLSDGEKQRLDTNSQEAFRRWRGLLDQEGFWSRLTERIRDLDDPRLTTGTARRMRTSLPLALLSINAQLAVRAAERGDIEEANRHVRMMHESGFEQAAIDGALRRAVEPIRERIKMSCRTAEPEADADPVHADQVTRRLLEQTQPLLAMLDTLLPVGNPTREGAHDEVALRALACQIPFGNKTKNWKISLELLELALPVAASESARTRIQENLGIVESNLTAGVCWFCLQNQPDDKASIEVPMHGNIQRTPTWQGTRVTWQKATITVPRCEACKRRHRRLEATPIIWLGWCLFVLFLWPIGIPVSLFVFIRRFHRQPSPAIGRFLGFVCGEFAIFAFIWTTEAMKIQFENKASLLGLFAIIGLPLLLWVGGRIGRHFSKKAGKPTIALPESAKNDFPPIKEQLKQGWSFGTEPVA